jgi:SAM-dependent methyltransferase
MQVGALRPYERALSTSGPLALQTVDGGTIALDVARWLAPVDAADESVLARCVGPTLDVGCGPGRFVASLAERGVAALGVDIAETAVAITRRKGMPALLRSVFARVPGEGRWPTVLLMDGNVGIGGDPARLLARIRALLMPGGRLIVETHPDADTDELLDVRFSQHGTAVGPRFGWALVGLEALRRYAASTGYCESEVWTVDGRTFLDLSRTTRTT